MAFLQRTELAKVKHREQELRDNWVEAKTAAIMKAGGSAPPTDLAEIEHEVDKALGNVEPSGPFVLLVPSSTSHDLWLVASRATVALFQAAAGAEKLPTTPLHQKGNGGIGLCASKSDQTALESMVLPLPGVVVPSPCMEKKGHYVVGEVNGHTFFATMPKSYLPLRLAMRSMLSGCDSGMWFPFGCVWIP